MKISSCHLLFKNKSNIHKHCKNFNNLAVPQKEKMITIERCLNPLIAFLSFYLKAVVFDINELFNHIKTKKMSNLCFENGIARTRRGKLFSGKAIAKQKNAKSTRIEYQNGRVRYARLNIDKNGTFEQSKEYKYDSAGRLREIVVYSNDSKEAYEKAKSFYFGNFFEITERPQRKLVITPEKNIFYTKDFTATSEYKRRKAISPEQIFVTATNLAKLIYKNANLDESLVPKIELINDPKSNVGNYNLTKHSIEINLFSHREQGEHLMETIVHEVEHSLQILLWHKLLQREIDGLVSKHIVEQIRTNKNYLIFNSDNKLNSPLPMSQKMREEFIELLYNSVFTKQEKVKIYSRLLELCKNNPEYQNMYKTVFDAVASMLVYCSRVIEVFEISRYKSQVIDTVKMPELNKEQRQRAFLVTLEKTKQIEQKLDEQKDNVYKGAEYLFNPLEIEANEAGKLFLMKELKKESLRLKEKGELSDEQEVYFYDEILKVKKELKEREKGQQYFNNRTYRKTITDSDDKKNLQSLIYNVVENNYFVQKVVTRKN